MRRNLAIAAACVASMTVVGTASAQFSLTANTGFGGGDGWRAPLEVLAGDTAGSAGASGYNYLGTANLERGMAYNPVTGNLVLVSRSPAGNGIRVLSGSTGADAGFLNLGTGVITGGTFFTNMVGVAEDGAIYVGNLATNESPLGFRTYRWANETATGPTVFSTFAPPLPPLPGGQFGTPRMGDSMDVIGSGANTRIVASGSNVLSYGVIRGDGSFQLVNNWGGVTGTTNSFRLGITFGPSADEVWGKSTGSETSVGFSVSSYNASGGVFISDSLALGGQGVAAMDYVKIGDNSYLAALNMNASIVSVYNVNDPLVPVLIATGPAPLPQAQLAPNGNATGSVKWGAINPATGVASIYAMSSNQGITALTFSFPAIGPVLVKGDFGGNESSDGSFNSPDGAFDGLDIEGFLLALNDQASYLVLNPTLGPSLVGRGDFGGNESTDGSFNTPDGAFDGLDIEGFLLALNDPAGYAAIQPPGVGGVSVIPEPAALGLLAPLGLLMARRRRA